MIPCRRPDHSGTFWAMWAMVSGFEARKMERKGSEKVWSGEKSEPGFMGLLRIIGKVETEFQTASVRKFANLAIFTNYPINPMRPKNPRFRLLTYIYAPKKLVCR
jgi:hypothetical protein